MTNMLINLKYSIIFTKIYSQIKKVQHIYINIDKKENKDEG